MTTPVLRQSDKIDVATACCSCVLTARMAIMVPGKRNPCPRLLGRRAKEYTTEGRPRWAPHVTQIVPITSMIEPVISGHLTRRVQLTRNPVSVPVIDDMLNMIIRRKPVAEGDSKRTPRKKSGALKRMALVMTVRKKLESARFKCGKRKTRSSGMMGRGWCFSWNMNAGPSTAEMQSDVMTRGCIHGYMFPPRF